MTDPIEKETSPRRPYRVYVVGGGYDYIRMMWDLGYVGARSPDDADVVLFTGGEDVDPSYYNEGKLKETASNPARDRREAWIYNKCLENKIPMVGICRGAQFLNVMNGGKMWQHVRGHCGNHDIIEVLPKDAKRKPRGFKVTSTHHQMMRPLIDKDTQILAVGIDKDGKPICDSRQSFKELVEGKDGKAYPDYEVVFYGKTNSLCFQPHPEFGNAPKDCTEYFDELLEEYVVPNCA